LLDDELARDASNNQRETTTKKGAVVRDANDVRDFSVQNKDPRNNDPKGHRFAERPNKQSVSG
jgi:hypothetical protein